MVGDLLCSTSAPASNLVDASAQVELPTLTRLAHDWPRLAASYDYRTQLTALVDGLVGAAG
jgi:hypothetical protein